VHTLGSLTHSLHCDTACFHGAAPTRAIPMVTHWAHSLTHSTIDTGAAFFHGTNKGNSDGHTLGSLTHSLTPQLTLVLTGAACFHGTNIPTRAIPMVTQGSRLTHCCWELNQDIVTHHIARRGVTSLQQCSTLCCFHTATRCVCVCVCVCVCACVRANVVRHRSARVHAVQVYHFRRD
jgi:hypothetical protein